MENEDVLVVIGAHDRGGGAARVNDDFVLLRVGRDAVDGYSKVAEVRKNGFKGAAIPAHIS